MKTNSFKFILDLSTLQGKLREIVSEYVQRELFKMGFEWMSQIGAPKEQLSPRHVGEPILHVHQSVTATRTLSFGSVATARKGDDSLLPEAFGAENVEEFLAVVRDGLCVAETICGVNVLITPKGVTLDPTELLAEVTKQAEARRKELWG